MIPSASEIARGIYGAWRLAVRDSGGVAFFDDSVAGFWKSFFAGVLVAPAYCALVLMEIAERGLAGSALHAMLIHLLAYVLRWVAFPVLAERAVKIIDREGFYLRLIVGFNWSQVIQTLIYLPLVMLSHSAATSGSVSLLLALGGLVLVLIYEWYVIRETLDCSGSATTALVALDLALSIAISIAVSALTLTPPQPEMSTQVNS